MPGRTFVALLACLIAGCAANSGIVPIGPDTYMVSRQSGNAFAGASSLKAEAIAEGSQYCVSKKQVFQLVRAQEAQPPYILGNYPRAEIQFVCLSSNDKRLGQPALQPNTVIEKRTY